VSGYKFLGKQVVSLVIQSLMESSGAVGLKPDQITVKVPEIDCKKGDKPINFIALMIKA
jgi:hypothetical protein